MGLVRVGSQLLNESEILSVDLSGLERLEVAVRVRHGSPEPVLLTGQGALDFVMRNCPSAVEGPRLRFARRAWVFHNLVAHPGMQILSWLGMRGLGLRLHDAIVPRPTVRR